MQSGDECIFCGRVSKAMCGGCRTRYCNEACQRRHWSEHKNTCPRLPSELRKINFGFCKGNILDSEFVTTATSVTKEKIGETVQRIFCHPAVNVPSELSQYVIDAFGGRVDLDCSLFIQFVLACAGMTDSAHVFCIGSDLNWVIMRKATRMVASGADHTMFPGYYSPENDIVADALQSVGGDDRGQWLLGPDKHDRYLGLTSDGQGPCRSSLEWWHPRLIAGLHREKDKYPHDCSDLRVAVLRTALACLPGGPLGFRAYTVRRYHAPSP